MGTAFLLAMVSALWAAGQGGVGGAGQGGAAPAAAGAPATAPETKPEDRCTIEGQVVNAATGEPVKKANLVLRRADLSPGTFGMQTSYSTSSDAGGKFAMKELEPGKYRLSVTRNGFVNAEYGSRGFLLPGTTLSLDRAQHLKEVVFRLTPHGVIAGRVLDEDGEPLANVQVQAMRYRYNQGKKQLQPMNGANTNDLGEYRIFGLAPGKYYLTGTYRQSMMFEPTVDRSATAQPDEDYVATYYPGATDPAAASALDVAPGGQLRGIDLTLSRTRTVRIRGRVVNQAGGGRRNLMVSLVPRDRWGFFGMNRPTPADAGGNFEIRGVAPGAYTVTAMMYDTDRVTSARAPVDVGTSNIENLVLTLSTGMELSGRVRVEGDAPAAALSDIRVILRPRDPGSMMFGPGAGGGRVKDDGSFTLTNVNPDQYNVMVFGQRDGYYVKSVRAGDTDALYEGLDLTRGAAGPIEILLSPNAGQVEGVVQNEQGQPAAGASVTLIPREKERLELTQYSKMASTDQYGRFTLKSVDPGEYRIFAWEEIEPGAYQDPEYVKPFESKGETVSVREKGRENVQLKLIPANAPAQGEKRREGN